MPLIDRVTARIPSQRLIELTNPKTTGTGTPINTTILQLAVDDTEADFRIHAMQVYDDTDNRHIATGIQRVIFYLMEYAAQGAANLEERETRTRELLERLSEVTSRARLSPELRAREVASSEDEALIEDDEFVDYIPARPRTGRRNV